MKATKVLTLVMALLCSDTSIANENDAAAVRKMALNDACLSEWYPQLRDAYDQYLREMVGDSPDRKRLTEVYHGKRNSLGNNSLFGWHVTCGGVRDLARQATGLH